MKEIVGVDELYVRSTRILEKRLDDELLLIDTSTDIILNLNPLGTAVWGFLETPKRRDEIIEILCVAFPSIHEDQIREDTLLLLEQLVDRELLILKGRWSKKSSKC